MAVLFSRVRIENEADIFNSYSDAECRVWYRYRTNTYELLGNPSQTLQHAGLYNGQVNEAVMYPSVSLLCKPLQAMMLEERNEDGTWPRAHYDFNVHITIISYSYCRIECH